MKTASLRIFCTITLALLLGSCGFYLKGHHPDNGKTTLKTLYIKGINRYDDIASEVKMLAKGRDIRLTPDSPWVISLGDEELENWQASLTQSVTTNEYFLRLHVTLYIHHQGTSYKPIHLVEEAIFQDNADESSSKSHEKALIINELRQRLAENILQRVQYIANNPPDCDCDEPEPATAE